MASTSKRIDEKGRVQATLTFAKRLSGSLTNNTSPPTPASEVSQAVDRIIAINRISSNTDRVDLDKLGTCLWNLASKQNATASEDEEYTCYVRLFACLLVDCAQKGLPGSTSNEVRVLKCTIKAAKYCLDKGRLSIAEIAVERAAFYEERLKQGPRGIDVLGTRLSCEYHFLRIAVAWRQGRLDLAKLTLAKVNLIANSLDPPTAEELADILYEIGKDQLKQTHYTDTIFWLEKAHDLLTGHDIGSMSSDAHDLKFSTMHSMVRALVQLQGENNRTRAWNIVHDLHLDHGGRLAVALLKLDLYAAEPNPPPQEVANVLESIIGTVHMTEKNLMTILHHVHLLRSWTPSLAHDVLSSLIFKRLLSPDDPVWLEKALITLVWNATTSAEIANPVTMLTDFLNEVRTGAMSTLSPSATHAVQMLLWKCIESSFQLQQYDLAQQWCRLALHDMFRNAGASNVGKLQRKLMLCALNRSDFVTAHEAYSEMSMTCQSDLTTQYLLFKIALRSGDVEKASYCLDIICKASTKDATILYACVLEAQKTGDQALSIIALQKVLQKYDYGTPEGVHLPALLRCTARQLLKQAEGELPPPEDLLDDVCKVFEGAAKQARTSRRDLSTTLFTLAELDWFSRNSYNLALQHCTKWKHSYIVRTIESALRFIDLYPDDVETRAADDLKLRRLFCYFLKASLLTVMARQDDILETQMQHYLGVRKAVEAFRASSPTEMEKLGGGARDDLQKKFSSLLAYDFEAAARLKAWDSFPSIIKECQAQANTASFAILADITLASDAPTNVTIKTLQQIINVTWTKEGSNIGKLSRWMRCLFTLALTHSAETAEQLLEQAISIIQGNQSSHPPNDVYPAEELEWLACTTFNHAIDFYSSNQDAECRHWAEQALRLAHLGRDDGALHSLLQKKYQDLVWEAR